MMNYIDNSISQAAKLFAEFAADKKQLEVIAEVSQQIAKTFKNGNKVLICGNGGSATDAMHFAEECTGRFRKDRKALPVISLTDASHITCVANDFGFDEVFSRGVEAYGIKGDLCIGVSTSGNSQNVINACNTAAELGILTFALLGKNGGKLNSKCDFQLIAPGKTSDRIQEIHIAVLHIIVETIERILFTENYK